MSDASCTGQPDNRSYDYCTFLQHNWINEPPHIETMDRSDTIGNLPLFIVFMIAYYRTYMDNGAHGTAWAQPVVDQDKLARETGGPRDYVGQKRRYEQ